MVEDYRANFSGTRLADLAWEFHAGSELVSRCRDVDLIVNATSLGLTSEATPDLPWAQIPPTTRFYDMVYARGDTPLIRQAGESGHRCADGLGMLVGQGEVAFELWTGFPPPSGVMKRRILTKYSEK